MLRRCLLPAAFVLAVGSILPISAPASAAPAVIAQWKLDEPAAGDVAADQTGTYPGTPAAITGQILPAPSDDVAPVGYANPRSLDLSGDNYLETDNPLAQAGDFSICSWVRTSAGGTVVDASAPGIAADYSLSIGSAGLVRFSSGGVDADGAPVEAEVVGATPIADDAWHSICVTRDNATGAVTIYVDGVVDGQGATPVGPLGANPRARIGWGFEGATPFTGRLDEVAVYAVALTEAQVQNLRSGGSDPDSQPDLPVLSVVAPVAGAPTNTWAPVVGWDDATACQVSWDGAAWVDVDCAAAGADIAPPGVDGQHTLALRGRSAGSLWSSTSQTFVWDTTAPEVSAGADRQLATAAVLGDALAADATSGVVAYSWTKQSGPGSLTFDDPNAAQPSVSASKDGSYDLRLTVADAAGNVAHDDLTLVWDASSPGIEIATRPDALTNDATARFVFTVDEPLSRPLTVECSIDGKDFEACTSPVAYSGVSDGDHTWRIRATDALGNRRLHDAVRWTVDTAAPTLTRVGPEQIEIRVGTSYTDQGAVARDSREGDLTSSVVTTGRVDTSLPGTYTLTYSVKDAAGNLASTLSRTVEVSSPILQGVLTDDDDSTTESTDRDGLDLTDFADAERDGRGTETEDSDGVERTDDGNTLTGTEKDGKDEERDVVDSEELAATTEAAPATGLRRTGVGTDIGSILGGSLLVMGALFVMSRRRYA